jgi:hypothetical protein
LLFDQHRRFELGLDEVTDVHMVQERETSQSRGLDMNS